MSMSISDISLAKRNSSYDSRREPLKDLDAGTAHVMKCQFDPQTSIFGRPLPLTKHRVRGPIDEVVALRCVRWTDERKGERTTDLLMLSKRRQLRTTPIWRDSLCFMSPYSP